MNSTKPINILIKDFLSEVDCKANTISNYQFTLKVWVNWMVINADIKNPTKAHLLMYRADLYKTRKASTVDSYMTSVKLLFAYLAEARIYSNIAQDIKRMRKSSNTIVTPGPPFTPEGITRIIT